MEAFLKSGRSHILMVTNHGIHDWEIRSGLTDTGGQNHYVNAMTDTLVSLGFRVTIFNRGGFKDPVTWQMRSGIKYKNDHSRIAYLEGGGRSFIRKEDLDKTILDEEASFAAKLLKDEGTRIDLIISHYWDGAVLSDMLKQKLGLKVKHVWIPHSLGALKKENFKNKPLEVVKACRFDERIAYEKEVLPKIDAVGATSGDIRTVLGEFYGRRAELFMPPCINTDVVHPVSESECDEIYKFLEKTDPVGGANLRGKKFVLEVSRTDETKRKDVVIKAFASAHKQFPDTRLLLTISQDNKSLYASLSELIEGLGIRKCVVFLGMIPRNLMSELYGITTVYMSPSEMEGFGMSVQEACAARRATISSNLVPFATEYLLKDVKQQIVPTDQGPCAVKFGKAGIVVDAGKTDGFAFAIKKLLSDEKLRQEIAGEAYNVTIPYFTWPHLTKLLLEKAGVGLPKLS